MVAKLRSVQCKRYFSTRADKNCCNEKFVSVSDDNEFQLIHTLCCLSLSLFVMLSVFIALKHSTLNVSYLKQQQRRGKKTEFERITPLFQSCFSILELDSVWTLFVASFLLAVRSISISVVSFFLTIFFCSLLPLSRFCLLFFLHDRLCSTLYL